MPGVGQFLGGKVVVPLWTTKKVGTKVLLYLASLINAEVSPKVAGVELWNLRLVQKL